MKDGSASAAVVVGVDGSQASSNAVRWAIDEAISRDVPLRIVHVTDVEEQRPTTSASRSNAPWRRCAPRRPW